MFYVYIIDASTVNNVYVNVCTVLATETILDKIQFYSLEKSVLKTSIVIKIIADIQRRKFCYFVLYGLNNVRVATVKVYFSQNK